MEAQEDVGCLLLDPALLDYHAVGLRYNLIGQFQVLHIGLVRMHLAVLNGQQVRVPASAVREGVALVVVRLILQHWLEGQDVLHFVMEI